VKTQSYSKIILGQNPAININKMDTKLHTV